MKGLTIGKVAKVAGVNVETIRYYERLGILPQPKRRESIWGHGYRQYSSEAVNQLLFIRQAKEIGFTLKEIQELLSLRIDKKSNCDAVRKRAEAKLVEVNERLASLRRIKKAIEKLIKACRMRRPTDGCPILEALSFNKFKNREVKNAKKL